MMKGFRFYFILQRGESALHVAAENDHSEVVKLFLKLNPEAMGRSAVVRG